MDRPLVSIIIAAFNAERYVEAAINSARNQNYGNVEIIVVNDGSQDNTLQIVQGISDRRLVVISKENGGVSSARNQALGIMRGELFCFLDADDIFLPDSISSRVELFKSDPNLTFVDGSVIYTDEELHPTGNLYEPKFEGNPKGRLLRLDRACLFGPTWMIRREKQISYAFDEGMSHAEDLFFYLSICFQKETKYAYVKEPILYYRQHSGSAMANLTGLENGYIRLLKNLSRSKNEVNKSQLAFLRLRIIKIMFLSYLFNGKDPINAVKCIFRISIV